MMKASIIGRGVLLSAVTMFSLFFGLAFGGTWGCGSSSGSGTGGDALGDATSVTGFVLAPNGVDPVAGATVYIASNASALNLSHTKSQETPTASVSCGASLGGLVTCTPPSGAYCAISCSCSDGSFTLDTSECSETVTSVTYLAGNYTGTGNLECTGPNICTSTVTGNSNDENSQRMAVVTGAFDSIEDVLAKLGFGEVEDGELKLGTEKFSIYRGGGERDSELTVNPTKYPSAAVLFGSLTEMQKYHTIFINCGASETTELEALNVFATPAERAAAHLQYHLHSKNISADIGARLEAFVEQGGTLYVTDQAYDYVEKAFPTFFDFEGSDSVASTQAEEPDAAQLGSQDITTNATINNDLMKSWLGRQSSNTVSENTPNEAECDTVVNGNTSALNQDGTIHIGDFLNEWTVLKGNHEGLSDESFVWLTGPVDFVTVSGEDYSVASDVVRPLTVSKRIAGSGCLLYSSYHTARSCPTSGFWPQERILQYLIFQVGDKCVP